MRRPADDTPADDETSVEEKAEDADENAETSSEVSAAPRTLVVKDSTKLAVTPANASDKKPEKDSGHELEPPVDLFD